MSIQNPADVSLKDFSNRATKKVIALCDHLQLNGYTPKSLLNIFLLSKDSGLAFRRRLWTTDTGWSSTYRLLKGVKLQAQKSRGGRLYWESFVLNEVCTEVVRSVLQ